MESVDGLQTVVLNLADGRETCFTLPPNQAVVAAFELYEEGNRNFFGVRDSWKHPHLREHRLGYSCGDWIAYKDSRILRLN